MKIIIIYIFVITIILFLALNISLIITNIILPIYKEYCQKIKQKEPKTLIISLSKFLFVFHIIFEFYVKMLKFLGITIALLTIELVGVTITLIIVTTTGDDQELNHSTIITIGDIRQEFNKSDSFVLWITIGVETVELVALMVIIGVKH